MIYLYLLLCNILFIPCIFCSNAVHLPNESNVTNINHNLLDSRPSNDTKVPLLSEGGGSILPHGSDLVLPKETHDLPGVESEIGKSKIKPRKEAIYTEENVTKSQEDVLQSSEKNTNNQHIKPVDKPVLEKPKNVATNISTQQSTSTLVNKDPEKSSNTTKFIPKKPLTLNADKLLNTPLEVKPSHDTLVKNQLPSPNREKAYTANANSHPGMVMPIVITILLVPMFAVLGYMALRRGQEAWKNRHYKRMDFLLDGMYND